VTRDRLIDLGRNARKRGGWWSSYRDVLPGPYVQLEAEVTFRNLTATLRFRTFRPLVPALAVPGLIDPCGRLFKYRRPTDIGRR
jgi:hypothetical protein